MRKRKNSGILNLSICLALALGTACQLTESGVPDRLLGHWEVYNFEVENSNTRAEILDRAKALAFTVKYEFKVDFSYTITSDTQPQAEYGNWSWDPQRSELKLIIPQEDPQVLTVLRCDEEVTIVQSIIPPFGKVKTYLRRQNKEQ